MTPPAPPYGQQGYGQPASGPPGGYAPSGYGQAPYGGYVYPSAPYQAGTNSLAIVSLVTGIIGGFCGIGWIAAIVCGFIARGQIRSSGEKGNGMATVGIVLGFAWLALFFLYFIVIFVILAHASSSSSVDFNSLGALRLV